MWLLFLTLVLLPSLSFNLVIVKYVERPTRSKLILKSVRWVLTFDLLLLGIAALPVLRDGLSATGRYDLTVPTAVLWFIYFALPLLALRNPLPLTASIILVFWLIAVPETRLLLEAGLRMRGWISKTDRPFWWMEHVPRSIDGVDMWVAVKNSLVKRLPYLGGLVRDSGNAVWNKIAKTRRTFSVHDVLAALKGITRDVTGYIFRA
ncbi:hypothetical protein BJ166DRAFT_149926 [Pestalotiopsis sp. NC0098]|nr:hypothetical protein BJ166DRAFT_149926 [Pestalotiopsis sp. NC0098]